MTYKLTAPVKPMTKPFTKPPSFATPAIRELVTMHTTCRPAGSKAVDAFCEKYLDSIPGMTIDKAGNRILQVGDPACPVMWSSHTDTVHKHPGTQRVIYGGGLLSLHETSQSSCLGADCTVGVWLMINMIRRNVPGLYVFHDSEEVGGLGSSYIAKHTPELLDNIQFAIAFDRRGTTSVITHQGSRCASDAFGSALAAQLGKPFDLDTGGTFTDTANYTHIVPECTNISVGYYNAHTSNEYLDVSFAAHLLERLCQLDIAALPIMRDPAKDNEFASLTDGFGYQRSSYQRSGYHRFAPTLGDLVWDNPEVATLMLEELGITVDDFNKCLDDYYAPSTRKH